jgi:hypothetical protein
METTTTTRKLLISLTHQLYQELMLNIPTLTNTLNLFTARKKTHNDKNLLFSQETI